MAEKAITGHILAMGTGGGGEGRLDSQGRESIINAFLVDQSGDLVFEIRIEGW